jgi:hypothetical protein
MLTIRSSYKTTHIVYPPRDEQPSADDSVLDLFHRDVATVKDREDDDEEEHYRRNTNDDKHVYSH